MNRAPVAAFNALPPGEATRELLGCMHAPEWAGAVLAGRPYPDRESLLATAYRFASVLTDADLAAALAAHPRIGDRAHGPGAAQSQREQAGVDEADADLAEQLAAGNRAYQDRFGQIFLIRAAGRTGHQMLTALHERLANDPDQEARVVRNELAQIAQLRLDALLAELPEPAEPGDR